MEAVATLTETQRKYRDIREEFKKLSDIKEFGVQKFSFDWIVAKIAYKFYLQPPTVENIIFNRV